ncbi:MAG: ABC transporter substrate-binding protein [Egibacteraceae bacterium]
MPSAEDSDRGDRRLRWRGITRLQFAALCVVLVLIGVAIRFAPGLDDCAPGVEHYGPECVGVTDGGFAFSPVLGLDAVIERIQEENDWVEQQDREQDRSSVSIAYALPLPTQLNDESDRWLHELQGAHLAQRRANRTTALGDQPLIRLLVANAGDDNRYWEPVVAQLRDRVDSPDRLVAVISLGKSLAATQEAIRELTSHDIPVIAAQLTADDLTGEAAQGSVDGLARVAPTNSDEAQAAVAYLRLDPLVRRALLVQDTRDDDVYASTLGEAFAREFAGGLIGRVAEYDSSLPGVANAFARMMPNICALRPDVVYFAGRGDALSDFIEALPERTCVDFPINVVTGDAGVDVATLLRRQLDEGRKGMQAGLEANATFRYTALAHPSAWSAAPASFSGASLEYFQQDCLDCFTSLFPGETLDDSAAIMGHDAVVTAVRAIRSAAGNRDLNENPVLPGEVIQQLNQLHDALAVPGASGWISLDENGDPVNKAIPILQLRPDGTVQFVTLSSPLGTPFIPPQPDTP